MKRKQPLTRLPVKFRVRDHFKCRNQCWGDCAILCPSSELAGIHDGKYNPCVRNGPLCGWANVCYDRSSVCCSSTYCGI
jgi:hypothetical protein